jgi:hypothetical protein
MVSALLSAASTSSTSSTPPPPPSEPSLPIVAVLNTEVSFSSFSPASRLTSRSSQFHSSYVDDEERGGRRAAFEAHRLLEGFAPSGEENASTIIYLVECALPLSLCLRARADPPPLAQRSD